MTPETPEYVTALFGYWDALYRKDGLLKAKPIRVDDQQRLIVECTDLAWATQVRVSSAALTKKLNSFLPEPSLTGVLACLRPIRILVTGSRKWQDVALVGGALEDTWYDASQAYYGHRLVVVHGDCPQGADALAKQWAINNGIPQEAHPADWDQYGKRAGFVRNQQMVDMGADVCLAFIKDGSRGASHTAARAEEAGIPVRRFTA